MNGQPDLAHLPFAVKFAIASSGGFLLWGMLLGVWKWRQMLQRPSHRAHPYVDIAHRAALLYALACLVLAVLVAPSPFHPAINVGSVAAPITFFAVAVATYASIGLSERTVNQFERRDFTTTTAMWVLVAAEVGGTATAFAGFINGVFL